MQRAGFKLPSNFSFEPLEDTDTLGMYSPTNDTVCINSKLTAFSDLVAQNHLEESQGTYHPKTKL